MTASYLEKLIWNYQCQKNHINKLQKNILLLITQAIMKEAATYQK